MGGQGGCPQERGGATSRKPRGAVDHGEAAAAAAKLGRGPRMLAGCSRVITGEQGGRCGYCVGSARLMNRAHNPLDAKSPSCDDSGISLVTRAGASGQASFSMPMTRGCTHGCDGGVDRGDGCQVARREALLLLQQSRDVVCVPPGKAECSQQNEGPRAVMAPLEGPAQWASCFVVAPWGYGECLEGTRVSL